ncbi:MULTISPECIES: TIGR00282 family metallophosphoesterase [unclassified Mycoplasma]|uniref:TIGR00282 family metallophosphoesterase n=1 Tax=unclassified Mycoplasma TaxID=2683645 RepID=UPI00211BEE79|nr:MULTISPECIES: TIGR00282 family metallophosphoesterase [unclassified Mycoplasma]UUM20017.1 TIGR00282 family metallophosphoesterase [Mycoplasma sp. 1578d]UUM24998.1 TIGR00282 family metallophosphoesterase [Mycoplasma sp. 3686d]
MAKLKILFFGDVFGQPGINTLQATLPELKEQYQPDFIITQGENVSGRKGLNLNDYQKLKELGVNAITMGNHVWANEEIFSFIEHSDIIRPLNINQGYPGVGAKVFKIKNKKLLIISLMGITFNPLYAPWKQETANNFFDAFDAEIQKHEYDYIFVDFHGETTSEKNVFGLYADGIAHAICGTHTHVQTSDARKLPKGTLFITDVGMCGPQDSAIGANYEQVYNNMRFNSKQRFQVSPNPTQLNAVLLTLNINKQKNKIKTINLRNVLA